MHSIFFRYSTLTSTNKSCFPTNTTTPSTTMQGLITTATTTPINHIPRSQFNSINCNPLSNNIQCDNSTDLFQKPLNTSSTHPLPQDSALGGQPPLRIVSLTAQRPATYQSIQPQKPQINTFPSPQNSFQSRVSNLDGMASPSAASNLPPPKVVNRDMFLNNSRCGNNNLNSSGVPKNGVHRKYSDTDIVSEMNHMYKQSMFVRRTGSEEEGNPNQFISGTPPNRESTFNRLGKSL